MYRWLLCWRYLRTRYIALASVVSVTLGVATLIIVNSVMDGFTQEMQEKMHGILSDVIVESHSSSGLPNPAIFTDRIQRILGDELEGMTTVVHVPAIVAINCQGETVTRQINLIGIDTDSYASVSDFSKFLMHPENKKKLSFALHETGYAPDRAGFPESGWVYRRRMAETQKRWQELQTQLESERNRNQKLRAQIDRAGSTNAESLINVLPETPPSLPSVDQAAAADAADGVPSQAETAERLTSTPSIGQESDSVCSSVRCGAVATRRYCARRGRRYVEISQLGRRSNRLLLCASWRRRYGDFSDCR
jgi:lipoprotein-releasing system permease protein